MVFPPEAGELLGGLIALTFGIWLLLPFEVFTSAKSFSPFLQLGIPESAIGGFFLLYGIFGLTVLFLDLRTARIWKAYAGMWLWGALIFSFEVGNWRGPSFIFLSPPFIFNLVAFLKARPRRRKTKN